MQNDKILSPTDREMIIRQLENSLENFELDNIEQENSPLNEEYYLEVKNLLSKIKQKD